MRLVVYLYRLPDNKRLSCRLVKFWYDRWYSLWFSQKIFIRPNANSILRISVLQDNDLFFFLFLSIQRIYWCDCWFVAIAFLRFSSNVTVLLKVAKFCFWTLCRDLSKKFEKVHWLEQLVDLTWLDIHKVPQGSVLSPFLYASFLQFPLWNDQIHVFHFLQKSNSIVYLSL